MRVVVLSILLVQGMSYSYATVQKINEIFAAIDTKVDELQAALAGRDAVIQELLANNKLLNEANKRIQDRLTAVLREFDAIQLERDGLAEKLKDFDALKKENLALKMKIAQTSPRQGGSL